jgi:hypothetical protein
MDHAGWRLDASTHAGLTWQRTRCGSAGRRSAGGRQHDKASHHQAGGTVAVVGSGHDTDDEFADRTRDWFKSLGLIACLRPGASVPCVQSAALFFE